MTPRQGEHSINRYGQFALVILMGGLLFFQYTDWFQHPNQLAGLWSDSIKNYQAPWYHVKFDSTYSVYQGMNYPYGDHINTVDGQPLLSNSWKWLSTVWPSLQDGFPALNNLAILLSFLVAAFFLQLLFQAFRLPVWLTVVLPPLIVFLSPQTLRVDAHFGLAHVAAVPVTLYLLLLFWKKSTIGRSALIAGAILLFSLIHLYFLVILGCLVGAFHLVRWLARRDWTGTRYLALGLTIQLFLPAGLLLTWMNLTDPIPDRNAFPYGFFAYRAHLEGLFTSQVLPYFRWFDQQVLNIKHLDFEARNYVGLVAGVLFVVLLVGLLIRRFRALPLLPEALTERCFLRILFLALLLNLLFALGLPFIIPGLEPLLDYTGPVRQFRSMGRIAWNCYYGWHVVGWVALFYWASAQWPLRRWVLYGALLLTAYEAIAFARSVEVTLKPPIVLEDGQPLADLPIDYSTFQAVVTVPHFNVGSGSFWWTPEGYLSHHALMLGVRTGLPTTSSLLTRTSLQQTLEQLQLVTPPYRRPELLEALPNQRPLLLMWDKQQEPLSQQSYDHFLRGTEVLYEGERMRLLRLPIPSFSQRITERVREVYRAYQTSDLFQHGPFSTTDSFRNFAYAGVDAGPREAAYLGKGGLRGRYPDFTEVFSATLPVMAQDSQYVGSFWLYAATPMAARTEIILEEIDPADGTTLGQTHASAHTNTQLVDPTGWVLIELPFTRQRAGSRLRILLKNRDLRHTDLRTDEYLIRPKSTEVYRREAAGLWHNNRWWPESLGR